ncbi:protoporphyrinogen oxidase [Paenibacillus mendelii]|uniref:Coproporphyrinogen III oxidase n=1 Tax=Paenibacillus mendelii TaxID=206163 RepID=A0ABV6JA82_9BACL|nr:protoporphyrinogen oxidase [Paenibacillus mendelii]MCQ6560820.1 protoporphyrinogen oxidase [Paenibacillus mendelii]
MRRNGQPDRIVVIGGGISGLSSAFYLLQEAEARGRKLAITIVDPGGRIGGKISTLHRDGFVIERGPDSFMARQKPIIDLAHDLGIAQELVGTNPAAKKTYIVHRGKLLPMPSGLVLSIPTEIGPFMKTGILSWRGKLRAMMDLVLPAQKLPEDESLSSFLSRRIGTEAMERITEPLLACIYAGDLRGLSVQATFPQFREAERKFGSLIRGLREGRSMTTVTAGDKDLLPFSAATDFLTFKGGLGTMVDALDRALAGVQRRLGTKVERIETAEEASAAGRGVEQADSGFPYKLALSNGETIGADGIVLTTPAYDAADLLETHVDTKPLRSVPYVSVANIAMAFDKKSLGVECNGSGFVSPRAEGTTITACTWTSAQWLHSSPEDKVLLQCYIGRTGDDAIVDLPDGQLTAEVKRDIRELMQITDEPIFTEITRLHRSMPQYPVGHIGHMKAFRAELEEKLPGIWVTGTAFDGVGLPACIRQSQEAAVHMIERLERR